MADIHIGEIAKTESGKGRAKVYFHIPITAPVAGIVPTPTSQLSGLVQAEVDALADGSVVEVIRHPVVTKTQTQADIVASLRADYAEQATRLNDEYDFRYKFYGTTLNASA